jgi:hypothetical protein
VAGALSIIRAADEILKVDRREAWRTYEVWDFKCRLMKALKGQPLPPDWDSLFTSADYLPPPEGWPPPLFALPPNKLRLNSREREFVDAVRSRAEYCASPGVRTHLDFSYRQKVWLRDIYLRVVGSE